MRPDFLHLRKIRFLQAGMKRMAGMGGNASLSPPSQTERRHNFFQLQKFLRADQLLLPFHNFKFICSEGSLPDLSPDFQVSRPSPSNTQAEVISLKRARGASFLVRLLKARRPARRFCHQPSAESGTGADRRLALRAG